MLSLNHPPKIGLVAAKRKIGNALSSVENAVRTVGRKLMESYPPLRAPIMKGWELYVLTYVTLNSWRYSLRYARRTKIDPLEVVYVDPDRIEYIVEENGYPIQARSQSIFPSPKFKHAGKVVDGDWDRSKRRFEETDIYRAFDAHFNHGVDWEETVFFRKVVEFIEDGVSMWDCTSREEFEERCDELDRLYEAIKENGYLSQEELLEASADAPAERSESSRIIRIVNDELTICVGRDGDLLFSDGRNRLAIAKVLDLEEVPIWITVRHEQWQRFREQIAADPDSCEELPADLRTHPDLEDICS